MKEYLNAVIYARYSSHSQTEQSIEGQLDAAGKYADAHGYTIVREYCDRAQTGRNDNRAEFQRMMADTDKKQFDVIITWKLDRIGRSREDLALDMENICITVPAFVPWSIICSVPLKLFGADYRSMIYAVFLYAVPLIGWAQSARRAKKAK